MHSPLHERLEYLVHYSSQLIFISGDSVSHQQKTLEAFVFNQPDDTEIAYLTAQTGLELTDYRRQLCRQLLGQQVGSYVQSLPQLLAGLQQHAGPVLITITQAEHLPDALLQELWELVLTCRQSAHKQHVNVLLFGHSGWASRAKTWLPANNSQTPVLISSQSVMAQQVGSDLDTLINQRRQAFQARLDERAAGAASRPVNRLRSPWVLTLLVLVFVGCFAGLVGWQYGPQISQLFAPLDTALPPADNAPPPGSAYQELVNSPAAAPGKHSPSMQTDTQQPETPAPAKASPEVPATDTDTDSAAGDARITSWQAALDNLNRQERQAKADSPGTLTVTTNAPAQEPTARPQIDVAMARQLTAERAARQRSLAAATPQSAPAKPAAPATTDNQQLAELLTAQDFVIQLAGLKDLALLRQFVQDHQLGNQVWVYQTQRYGGDWFVLLFKQPFDSLTSARQALALVPDFPGKDQAFVKSGQAVLGELERAPTSPATP